MDTKQPEVLRLAYTLDLLAMDMEIPRMAAAELRRQHTEIETLRAGYDAARLEIASLHTQMEAVGAGGMEPLRKRECLHQISEPVQAQPVASESLVKWASLIELAQTDWHTGYEAARAYVKVQLECAAPQPAAQALDAKGGRWLTVVYRDIAAGQEARELGEHPKACALSWSHALNERDAAIAAQQGGANG